MHLSFKLSTRHAALAAVHLCRLPRASGRWSSPDKKRRLPSASVDLKQKLRRHLFLKMPNFWGSFSDTVCLCHIYPEASSWTTRSTYWDQVRIQFNFLAIRGKFPISIM